MDMNQILKSMIYDQINALKQEKKSMEENKDFRKIPLEVKSEYYSCYDILMGKLYGMVNEIEMGEKVSYDDYQDIAMLGCDLSDYTVVMLETYGINYKTY